MREEKGREREGEKGTDPDADERWGWRRRGAKGACAVLPPTRRGGVGGDTGSLPALMKRLEAAMGRWTQSLEKGRGGHEEGCETRRQEKAEAETRQKKDGWKSRRFFLIPHPHACDGAFLQT